jgi:DNA-binding NtrC family response regulator
MYKKQHPQHPIVVIDDEEQILLSIDTTLRMAGMNNIITCKDSRQVMNLLASNSAEVILLDLTMPHIDGEELLAMINNEFPDIPVIVVTGAVEVETAVRCMKAGAFDYVVKPVEEGRLLSAVNHGIAFRELRLENLALKQHILSDSLENPELFSEIVTNNKKMLAIFQYIESIAHTSQPVMITGETGTGKELIARAIHKSSDRKGNFVAVNVAGLDDNVFTDTLFGHVKGAFTGADSARQGLVEQAAGGTLMLDEVGDLSNASQVKLLRFLQEGEYLPLGIDSSKQADVRIIAVTNEDLPTLIRTGKFRKDLNYRLRTHRIHILPLRERIDDIPFLVDHFLEAAAYELGKEKPTPPSELFTLLGTYSFPGNIRELRSIVFDAMSRQQSERLSLQVFKSHITKEQGDVRASIVSEERGTDLIKFSGTLPTIKQATKSLIEEAMNRTKGNQTIAASMLGISQQALSKRLKQRK